MKILATLVFLGCIASLVNVIIWPSELALDLAAELGWLVAAAGWLHVAMSVKENEKIHTANGYRG